MEVVEDESIATSSTAAPKLLGKPRMEHYRAVDTTLSSSSMLSIEAHPPSARSSNAFFQKTNSSETFDSRHDSPETEPQDSDAMMTSNDTSSSLALPSYGDRLQTTTSTRRVLTGESITHTPITNISSIRARGREEQVSLAPRFGKLETKSRDDFDQAQGEQELGNPSMFSLSGSMSSEFLESQQHSDDHQQEYLHHPNRLTISSPTSTTARDFLREVQGPPPLPSGESMSRSFGSPTLPLHHRFQHTNSAPSRQRPPSSGLPSSPNFLSMPSLTHRVHATLPREHIPNNASSPSPSNTIQGTGSFNCDRDKPVISRCFAWSHDSQDDRRITKRPRMAPTSSASSPHSTGTAAGVMSPSSALETIRDMSPPRALTTSPTKVHWEEKVEHSNELMSHAAVDPQVLFNVTSAIAIAAKGDEEEDVAMGNTDEEGDASKGTEESRMPPPITTARSASHYSFDSL